MKRAVGWVVALVVLAGVAVVGDRVAVGMAEDAAVTAFQQQADDVTGAELDILGFPFLTQAAQGELTHVTGSATTASFGGWTVDDLAVDARGVSIRSPYTVASGTASGTIPVATLEQALRDQTGLQATMTATPGTLALSGEVLGLPVSVSGTPRVDGPDVLGVEVGSVQAGSETLTADDLPAPLAAFVSDIRVRLALPDGVALQSLVVVDGGVRATVTGTDVPLDALVAS